MLPGRFPARWAEGDERLPPYPLGQPLGKFTINGLGIGHRFLRKSKSLLDVAGLEYDFSPDGDKNIVEDQPFLTKANGRGLLLCHICKSLLMMAESDLSPRS